MENESTTLIMQLCCGWGLLRDFPAPPNEPEGPMEGFDDEAILLAKLGYALAVKSIEESAAAAHRQWRSYIRLDRKKYREECSLGPLYTEFYEAVDY